MNKLSLKYYLLTLVSIVQILGGFTIHCQQSQNQSDIKFFDKTKWQETVQGSDFNETFKEPKEKDRKKNDEFTDTQKDFNLKPLIGAGVMKIILIIFIIGILSFLLFIILKNSLNFFAEIVPENKLAGIVENLDENIHNADFENILKQAIHSKQYKLAVRIFYLQIIKILADKELINWKKNKTNGHYVMELFQHACGQRFSFLTAVYEKVWFSTQTINEENFKLISNQFSSFIKKLK